jgi:hypothetical protein
MAVEGSIFENLTEVLDGKEYQGCEFHHCRLVYRGGTLPKVSHCHFSECEWVLEDAAGRTISLLKGLYHGGGSSGRKLVEATLDSIRKP